MPRARTARITRTAPSATAPADLPPVLRGKTPVATVPVTAAEFPALAHDPNAYASVVDGDCLAPLVFSGDLVLVSPSAPLEIGEFVVLHPHQGRPLVKRLVVAPPPFEFGPGSDVEGLVIVEQLNPPRHYYVPTRQLHSVHAVVGIMPRAQFEAKRKPVQAVAAEAGGPIPGAVARRGLLGAAGALVAAPAIAKGADLRLPAAHPDAELIAACDEFCRIEQALQDLSRSLPDDVDVPDATYEAACDGQDPHLNRIIAIQPTTLDGHLARARCYALYEGDYALRNGIDDRSDDPGTRLRRAMVFGLMVGRTES